MVGRGGLWSVFASPEKTGGRPGKNPDAIALCVAPQKVPDTVLRHFLCTSVGGSV
jgi:hypothetical protein